MDPGHWNCPVYGPYCGAIFGKHGSGQLLVIESAMLWAARYNSENLTLSGRENHSNAIQGSNLDPSVKEHFSSASQEPENFTIVDWEKVCVTINQDRYLTAAGCITISEIGKSLNRRIYG